MSTVSDIADAVQAFATAGGIVAGGVFTYYKFIKDRIYRPRLDLDVACEIVSIGNHQQLICRMSIHNKGSTKIELLHRGTALILTPCTVDSQALHTARWSGNDSGKVNVFAVHDWIENNETIRDDALISLGDELAYRVEFWLVVSNPAPRDKRNISFSTARVIVRPQPTPPQPEGAIMGRHSDDRRDIAEPTESTVDDNTADQAYEDPERTEEIEEEKQNP